uniref:Reverse transcriptase zinc-binding domain-containing protein n=1 Tax=Aegilops tauschii subsp. strangulata TaxID=200361 RepID=A0A453ND11_AEGTS
LISLLMYVMGFYSLHESLHHEVTKLLSRFFWAGENNKQKYHMVKWSEIYKPKGQGGLGVISSKRVNIALLSKWLWRIQADEGGLWLEIIQAKYLRGQPLAFAPRFGGSQFWQSVIRLMSVLRIRTSIKVGTGSGTLFWLDRWAGTRPFAERFYALFSICVRP